MSHALVCGASQGIGRATAIALARAGHAVSLLARDEALLRDAAVDCETAGAPDTHVLPIDMDDTDALRTRVRAHAEARPIDIVINNTGGPPGGPLHAANEDDLLGAFRRHVLAAHTILQEVLPGMEARGWGRIVNITSIGAKEPIVGLGVSNIVRHAMGAWAKTLSKELPPGITVNSVLPGYTDTGRLAALASAKAAAGEGPVDQVFASWTAAVPEGRLAQPAEVAATVAWLCSDAASFVRGQSIAVDGGLLGGI